MDRLQKEKVLIKLANLLTSNDIDLLKLSEVTLRKPTDQVPLFKLIYQFYHSKSPNGKSHVANQFLATVMDSCCTQLLTKFLLSYGILSKLIENNPNITRKTCSGIEYKLFMKKMLESGVLIKEEEPSLYGSGKAKAGLYRIAVDEVLDYVNNKKEEFKQNAENDAHQFLLEAEGQYRKTETIRRQERDIEPEILIDPKHSEDCQCKLCIDYSVSEIMNLNNNQKEKRVIT
jgi:hypothetical protein